MPGRPGTLPWNMATFTGNEPVTTLSDNFSFLNNQINDSGIGINSYAVDTGTTNNLIVTLTSAPVSYETGMMIAVTPANTNTAASVINVNSLGNVGIVNPAGLALNQGELNVGATTPMVYDGTHFRIIGPCSTAFSGSSASGTQAFNCAGYDTVLISKTVTGAGTAAVNLQNVSPGNSFFVTLVNNSGGPQNYGVQELAGTNSFYTMIKTGGTIVSGDFNSAFISVSNGTGIRVWGAAFSPSIILMTGILG